jgi:hypothetical protein
MLAIIIEKFDSRESHGRGRQPVGRPAVYMVAGHRGLDAEPCGRWCRPPSRQSTPAWCSRTTTSPTRAACGRSRSATASWSRKQPGQSSFSFDTGGRQPEDHITPSPLRQRGDLTGGGPATATTRPTSREPSASLNQSGDCSLQTVVKTDRVDCYRLRTTDCPTEDWEITFSFAASPNATDLTVGDITLTLSPSPCGRGRKGEGAGSTCRCGTPTPRTRRRG